MEICRQEKECGGEKNRSLIYLFGSSHPPVISGQSSEQSSIEFMYCIKALAGVELDSADMHDTS